MPVATIIAAVMETTTTKARMKMNQNQCLLNSVALSARRLLRKINRQSQRLNNNRSKHLFTNQLHSSDRLAAQASKAIATATATARDTVVGNNNRNINLTHHNRTTFNKNHHNNNLHPNHSSCIIITTIIAVAARVIIIAAPAYDN